MEKGSDTEHSKQDQRSPGVLNEGLIGQFKTIREDIVELAIDLIEPFPLIPDYRDPTESNHPVIIKSPAACRCVDGWNLIEGAKAAGNSSIRCHVFEMVNHSDTEFAIRKVSVRTKPLGGPCSYAETLRNTRLLVQIIMAGRDDLVVFSHGGSRRGGNFTSNREDDLREILVERLGKSRTTINTYLNQSEYLNDAVFDALITADVGKIFFDKCRVIKRDLIKNLKSDGIEDIQVTATVSEKMLEWHVEFLRTGNINSNPTDTDDDEIDEPPASDLTGEEVETSEDEVFQHQTRIDPDDSPGPPTEVDVQNEIRTIASALSVIAEQSPMEVDARLEIIDEQIRKLATIRQMLISIKNSSLSGTETEAA